MSFSCADCEQTFNNTASRNHHRWSQHSEIIPITVNGKQYGVERKGNRLLCPVERCTRSYAGRETFTRHVKVAHAVVKVSARSYSPVGSSQQDGRRQRLSQVIEASGGEGRGEALPPTTSSAASKGKLRVDVSMRQGHTTPVKKSVAGGSGSTQAGGNRLVERSLLGAPVLLDTRELAAQVSDMVIETVVNKLTAIGLTAENIKKLEYLAAVPPLGAVGGSSQVASLADAVLGQLTAIGLTEENVKKLATLGGETPSLASSESSQAVQRPIYLDDAGDLTFPSSFTDDPSDSSTCASEKNRQRGSFSSSRMSTGRLKRLVEGPLLSDSSQFAKPSHPPQTKLHPFDTLPRLYDSQIPISRRRKRVVVPEVNTQREKLCPRRKKRKWQDEVD